MLALQKLGLTLTALSVVALFTPAAHAQTTTPITVNNFSFEDPAIGASATDPSTPPGWTYNGTQVDTSGTYATGIQSYRATTDGIQYGFIFAQVGGYDLEQNTGLFATVGDTYTLTADVATQDVNEYAQIKLTDGNGSYTSTPVQSGAFATQTVTFTALPGTGTKTLNISLLLTDANGNINVTQGQGDFDNVHLTETAPIAAAPEPSAWVGLAVGALGLGALSFRARRRTVCA